MGLTKYVAGNAEIEIGMISVSMNTGGVVVMRAIGYAGVVDLIMLTAIVNNSVMGLGSRAREV